MTQVYVKIAEVQTVHGEAQFYCVGLGSCIGVAMYDPKAQVAGMAHVMLPETASDEKVDRPGKYANLAIPQLIANMEALGADRSRVVAAIAGGAQVVFGKTVPAQLVLGSRNSTAVQRELEQLGVQCVASDLGGNRGRTFVLDSGSGNVTVRTTSTTDRLLCTLG